MRAKLRGFYAPALRIQQTKVGIIFKLGVLYVGHRDREHGCAAVLHAKREKTSCGESSQIRVLSLSGVAVKELKISYHIGFI